MAEGEVDQDHVRDTQGDVLGRDIGGHVLDLEDLDREGDRDLDLTQNIQEGKSNICFMLEYN